MTLEGISMTTKVTGKGTVKIAGPIRDRLGVGSGSNAVHGTVVTEKSDGPPLRSRFADARGSVGPGLTNDQLMALLRGEPR